MKSTHLLWKDRHWPALRYDGAKVASALARARRAQGVLEGKLTTIGFDERQSLAAEAWTQEAMSTSAIEGEQLDLLAVRSSVARRLSGAKVKGPAAPRHVDGLLDIMDDAVANAMQTLTHKRLCAWQAGLFPTGYSGMRQILVGGYRKHPMQIVSGPAGREVVHYEAPPAGRVTAEMKALLDWFNRGEEADRFVQAAVAHLWFETIHPFEDGNGRVGRVLVDLALARDSGEVGRLMRISQRLLEKRDEYYEQLESAQHGTCDVTAWVAWFVEQVGVACEEAVQVVDASLAKARFWATHRDKPVNERQRKVLNVLLDAGPGGFEGGLSTRKHESLTSASRATSSRDLLELEEAGLLKRVGAGRSTRYYINLPGW
ncbi:Fic family protein [Caenimonas koreensis]|uniref:Fic family protein n=1 Tax=Caenimonas koreensis TaxID=367474 RepID=UPI0037843CD2